MTQSIVRKSAKGTFRFLVLVGIAMAPGLATLPPAGAATNDSQLALLLPSCERRTASVDGIAPIDGIYALKVNVEGTDTVRVVDNQQAREGESVHLVAPEYPAGTDVTYSVTLSGPDDTSGVVLVDYGTAARPTAEWCAAPPAVG